MSNITFQIYNILYKTIKYSLTAVIHMYIKFVQLLPEVWIKLSLYWFRHQISRGLANSHGLLNILDSRSKTTLPVLRHCPRTPRNIAETCQRGHPHNSQSLKKFRASAIHPRGGYCNYLTPSVTSLPEICKTYPFIPKLGFHYEMHDSKTKEIFKVFIQPSGCPTKLFVPWSHRTFPTVCFSYCHSRSPLGVLVSCIWSPKG